ncbi:KTSC domain-containing protein [Cronobacter malonaticus]
MQREDVVSRSLASVGYDLDRRVLEIAFHSGAVYHYLNVPEHVWLALARAPSKGRYFRKAIQDRFPYQRVE